MCCPSIWEDVVEAFNQSRLTPLNTEREITTCKKIASRDWKLEIPSKGSNNSQTEFCSNEYSNVQEMVTQQAKTA